MSKGLFKFLLGTAAFLGICSDASAYLMDAKFKTDNYAVYEVILSKSETYSSELKHIIAKDLVAQKKFQTTAIVFPYNTQGLKGTIKEEALGVITTEQYNKANPATVLFDDKANAATYAGIYLTYSQLSKIADNRTVNSLVTELAKMPLVITDMPVTMVSKDFSGKLFYTISTGSIVLDFQPIDSLYYKKDQLKDVTNKCTISILAIADRTLGFYPYFIAAHGAVNDIKCK
ncbi:MAG: hypothetical protein ACI4M9_06965 [Succinivibrio sp.]